MILKVMTDNIDEPFPSAIAKSNTFSFNSNVRVYQLGMNISNPVDGEILICKYKAYNPHHNYIILIM